MLSWCVSAGPAAATSDKVCWSSRRPWRTRGDAQIAILGYSDRLNLPARPLGFVESYLNFINISVRSFVLSGAPSNSLIL